MSNFSKRFIKKWRSFRRINPIRRDVPVWMSEAIEDSTELQEVIWYHHLEHRANIRGKEVTNNG